MTDTKEKKLSIVIIGQLLSVGGSSADEPVATFAPCDGNGEPYLSAAKISIPLGSDADARKLGAQLYSNFAITIEQCGTEPL